MGVFGVHGVSLLRWSSVERGGPLLAHVAVVSGPGRAYEHAVLAAGTDFRSDRLWESYVNWEAELGNLAHVTAVYDRILGIPTQLYSHHFQR